MEIRKTYIGKIDGKGAICCGHKPENLEVETELPILYPSENMLLKRKSDGEVFDSVALTNGDSMENYEEVEAPKEEEDDNGN